MKRWIAILLAGLLLLSGCAASGDAQQPGTEGTADKADAAEADWTVLLYLCGTDLESESELASGNLLEIAQTTPNEHVNVLIETGGTREWHAESAGIAVNADRLQRFCYDSRGYTLLEEQELQNMASAQTLTDFIRWGAEAYPAEKYLLCIWDHGGGSNGGLIVDERFGNASMSVEELGRAVDAADTALEAVVLDSCMMANLETAQALSSAAHYLIASEELVSGTGTAYREWLQYLYDTPDCLGEEFGRAFCDGMQRKYDGQDDAQTLTFFTIDLTQMDAVSAAFAQMAREMTALLADPAAFRPFADAAEQAEHYNTREMIDLADLASRAGGNSLRTQTADAVAAAVRSAVCYGVKGETHSGSNGISFWYQPSAYRETLDHYARSSAKNPEYLAFLDAASAVWSAPEWVYEAVERPAELRYSDYVVEQEVRMSEDGGVELTITNAAQAVSSVAATLCRYDADGGRWLCYGSTEQVQEADGGYASGFNGTWLALNGTPCQVRIAGRHAGSTFFDIPVLLEWEDGYQETKYLRAAFTPDASGGRFTLYGLWNDLTSNTEMPGRDVYAISTLAGATMYPLLTAGDPDYGLTEDYVPQGDGFAAETAALSRTALPDGRYTYRFVTTDLMGQEIDSDLAYLSWDGESASFSLEEQTADSAAAEG